MTTTTKEVRQFEGRRFNPANPPIVRPRAARTDWMQTQTNLDFFPTTPEESKLNLEDIAHHLAMQCRFNGAVSRFYSVAEHSVRVSWLVDWNPLPAGMTREERAAIALMHDAPEAYLHDIISPLKALPEFAGYRKIESVLELAVLRRFKLKGLASRNDEVKLADGSMCHWEKLDLKGTPPRPWNSLPDAPPMNKRDGGPLGWSWEYAKKMFLARADSLGLR